MSGWEDFKTDATKIASKAALKAGEVADAATARLRIQGIKLRLCEEYEKLGRLVYKSQKENSENPEKSSIIIAQIDKLRAEKKKIENEIKTRKEAHQPESEQTAEGCE